MPHKIAGNYPSPYGDEPRTRWSETSRAKPAYHFGWDWGPRYVTAGVWRGVDLQAWDTHRLTSLAVRTDALSAEQAKLAVLLQVEQGSATGSAVVNVEVLDPQGRSVASSSAPYC